MVTRFNETVFTTDYQELRMKMRLQLEPGFSLFCEINAKSFVFYYKHNCIYNDLFPCLSDKAFVSGIQLNNALNVES